MAQQAKYQGQKLFKDDKKQEKIEPLKTDENQLSQIPEKVIDEQASSPQSSPLANKSSKQADAVVRDQIDLLDGEDDVDLIP